MARVESLLVEGDPDRWRSLGLTVVDDGLIPLVGTSLRLVAPVDASAPAGIVGWRLSGVGTRGGDPGDRSAAADDPPADRRVDVDGLATTVTAPADPVYAQHALGAVGLDHVVVITNDLERTSAAVAETTGCELRRVREVGAMRQGFHRIGGGGLIVEIVERAEIDAERASFWGVVVNVDDLDAACRLLGDERIGEPRAAVQPGRRIATVRREVGLGVPLALMTP